MFYSSFGILALALLLIINFDVLRGHMHRAGDTSYAPYRDFLFSVMCYYVSDILWGILYESGIVPLAYLDTVLYFATMVISVLMWTRYVIAYLHEQDIFGKLLSYAGWVILIYEAVNLTINFFFPVVFAFDPDGTYTPMWARYVTLAVQVLLFFGASCYSFIAALRSQDIARSHYHAIGVSGLIMTVFIILQTAFPFLPFYAIGCMLGTCLLHSFVLEDEMRMRNQELEEAFRKEREQRQELETARQMAYTDSLTGVKNKHAYVEAESRMEERIEKGDVTEFGVIVFDINDLKVVNDTMGHEEGDRFIRTASIFICRRFKHSPVYRIGGDEFVVLLEGEDYENRETLLGAFDAQIEDNLKTGAVVISGGMDIYRRGDDDGYRMVFERADRKMYERKRFLKEKRMSGG
ncbi:MAG: GGDEF domain-containing protein [Lachnospiraceae bacterium]|nr:GGDEF domain-containing protein [Lachnospiraceae bacterium]